MGKRILVIDDEKMLQRLMTAILVRAGHAVRTASSIPEAVALLAGGPVDLITCDLMLSETSGLDFLRMMQDGTIQPAVPVVVITAVGFPAELAAARALGAACVLKKPFTAPQLREVVASFGSGT